MSIATEITRLQTAKSALKTSIENKGVTVPSSTTLDGYAALVDQISGGATTCTLSISDDGIVASNFSSGTEPSRYSATGYDYDNQVSVTYYKDNAGLSGIVWIGSSGEQVASNGENFPNVWVSEEGMASEAIYSDAFSAATFSATVIVLPVVA